MRKTAVINLVGLTPRLLTRMPRLQAWAAKRSVTGIDATVPAVTCSVQATYLTGHMPARHGIVGNGWYDRDTCEVRFWHQSNKLVQKPKLWDNARALDPRFTCANLFWWYNMYSSVDVSVTPRPCYPADGRKIPDLYTRPNELRASLQQELGRFPLFHFWGPHADLRSSEWIANAARRVDERSSPTLLLVYLPHLDYVLQREGADPPEHELCATDTLCCDLIADLEARGRETVVLSEYGVTDVSRPVHINRILRTRGLVAVREELGRELLDAGASSAFAVADHQVAHVYVQAEARRKEVGKILRAIEGIEHVLDREEQAQWGIDHPRAGDFVLIADAGSWFTYYYWLDDARAPDFAHTVDIHRKPGYDPAELFIDPTLVFPRTRVAWKLARRALGFRTLIDVVSLDASLVRGSHGRPADTALDSPVIIHSAPLPTTQIKPTAVHDLILYHCLPEAIQPALKQHVHARP